MLRKQTRWLCAAADAERTRISHWVLYEALNAAGVGSDEPDDVSVGHFPLHNMVLLPRTPPTAAERARLKQAVLGVGLTTWTRDAHVILGSPGKYLPRAAEAFAGTTIVVHPQPEALLDGARFLAASTTSAPRRHVLHVRAPDPLFFLENCVEPNALRAVSLAHDASPVVDPRRSPAHRGRVLSMIHEKLQAGGTFGYWTHDVRAMHAIEDEFAHSAMTCPWDIVDPSSAAVQPLPTRGEAEHDPRCHLWLRKDGMLAPGLSSKSRLELELRTLV